MPAEPSHDLLRVDVKANGGFSWFGGSLCDENENASTDNPSTVVKPCGAPLPPVASNSPLTPFLQSPTNCDSPLSVSLDVLSYDGGTSHAEGSWPQSTGCDQLSFNPSLYAQPTTNETDTASGIDVNLSIPQQLSSTIPSPSELRAATVVLPPGFSINSSAADGKVACTDAEANFGTTAAAECPEFSKVGSVEIDSSALPGPLPGYVYLGQPLPANQYRIFLVADGFGTHLKLPGTVSPDPRTGQLTISFEDLPQSPLTAFNMHFFGSERGLLGNSNCLWYLSRYKYFHSVGFRSRRTDVNTILHPGFGSEWCAVPGFDATVLTEFPLASNGNTAGAHSPFFIELTRDDGDQDLSALQVSTPPGFSATIAGVPYCSDAALAAAAAPTYSGLMEEANPSCGSASQVGTATVGAGAGTHPVYVAGNVYLAGPYRERRSAWR